MTIQKRRIVNKKENLKMKEYKPPKSLPFERTNAFYGDQRMSMGSTKVREYKQLGENK